MSTENWIKKDQLSDNFVFYGYVDQAKIANF